MNPKLLSAWLCLALLAATPAAWAAKAQGRFDLSRTEIRSFIDEAVADGALHRGEVERLLRAAHPQPDIISMMSRPPEQALPWWRYRAGFLTPARIEAGARFWREHRAALERIGGEHGVPPRYIVAILGCETYYGRVLGRTRALDALATLAFDYPPRSDFFRGELREFLLLAHEQGLAAADVRGSYTGAMGAPQFMPSSYRKYGQDGDHDGHVDLWHDWDDVIASVANFLQQSGWAPGQPVLAPAQRTADSTAVPVGRFEFTQTLDSLNAQGVHADSPLPGTTPAMLVQADLEDGPTWRVGFQNFFVITRYNRSARYAMAVNDLADAIAAQVEGEGATTGATGEPRESPSSGTP